MSKVNVFKNQSYLQSSATLLLFLLLGVFGGHFFNFG